MDLLGVLGDYCAEIGEGQYRPQQKWLRDMLYGIGVFRSLMLSEIGRALGEDTALLYTEKRLSRGLNSDRLDEEGLKDRHLRMVGEWATRDDGAGVVIPVDYTDLSKPYANLNMERGMEGVCTCWDGSIGSKGTGYPVVQIEAHLPDGNQVPMILHPYSYVMEGFRSRNLEFLGQIKKAAVHVGPLAWWTFDRGFDSNVMLHGLDKLETRWICRLQISTPKRPNPAERGLLMSDGQHLGAYQAALTAIPRFKMDLPASQKARRRGKKKITLEIGARKVWMTRRTGGGGMRPERRGPARTLIVVWGFGKNPMVLLASEHLNTKKAILEVVRAYKRRWKAEEATRLVKDDRGWGIRLEDLRALTMRGVRRLLLLATIFCGFLARLRDRFPALHRRTISAVRAFGHTPVDDRYRTIRGLGRILSRVRSRRLRRWRWRERRSRPPSA